ncbi:putative isomerase, 3-hydroxyacyl-CoA dehydrogenase, Enoyl-CoA hydratase [Helianthus annuus]|nr:putative isomerase, 3-hydroxyacyl-CoA dehydrogenase, Enoyl-CoA hydratase [Helianthus annuus]KAJ0772432.1 putative isomerase, 3-hydroxyacyl-CoA dehydrogenase, Enoyl-CoA hydratase [Helianthus annuus]
MVLFPVVNEACRVLEEQIVVRASDLDIASVLGMSFPRYRYVQHCNFKPVAKLEIFKGGRKRIYPKISIEPGGRKHIYPKISIRKLYI